jgi:hypothetical protein
MLEHHDIYTVVRILDTLLMEPLTLALSRGEREQDARAGKHGT